MQPEQTRRLATADQAEHFNIRITHDNQDDPRCWCRLHFFQQLLPWTSQPPVSHNHLIAAASVMASPGVGPCQVLARAGAGPASCCPDPAAGSVSSKKALMRIDYRCDSHELQLPNARQDQKSGQLKQFFRHCPARQQGNRTAGQIDNLVVNGQSHGLIDNRTEVFNTHLA